MVELDFAVAGARFELYSAAPLMLFDLRVTNRTPEATVRNVALQAQVRIEPTRRRYGEREKDRLLDLFGPPPRWGETLNSFLWANAAVSIPGFETERTVALPVPCSFDFNIAATKYFEGLDDGEVPLTLLFSGSIFYRDEDARLQIEQVPWAKEASFAMPVAVWRAMIGHHYADRAWLDLDRAMFERLSAFKRENGLPSYEAALAALLPRHPAAALQ